MSVLFDVMIELDDCLDRATLIALAGLGSDKTGNERDGEAIYRGAYDLRNALKSIRDRIEAVQKEGRNDGAS